jgi:hypothetical protein
VLILERDPKKSKKAFPSRVRRGIIVARPKPRIKIQNLGGAAKKFRNVAHGRVPGLVSCFNFQHTSPRFGNILEEVEAFEMQ